MIIHWIFLVLVLWTVPSTSLVCYICSCPSSNTSACNCSDSVNVADGAHCTIIEDFNPSKRSIELSPTFLNSSYIRIKDPYYIIVDESIFYNETTTELETRTKRVIYGCDWDYCNNYTFISSLPDTFNLTIDPVWFNETIYGNGSVNSCYNCSDGICGNETHIDYNLCPLSSCENSTTCSLRDLWHDVETNESCYRSECTPSQSTEGNDEKYKVQVETIVYLAQNRSKFEIWELDINCAAVNCSRPTIFQEIKGQIRGEISNLTDFPLDRPTITTSPPSTTATLSPTTTTTTLPPIPLNCYVCSCNGTTCPCSTTVPSSTDNTYCIIKRTYSGQDIHIDYGHIDTNSSYFNIRDFPYVLLAETTNYNEISGRWNTQPDYIIYGCNWNLCNNPDLVSYLPSSVQMRLSEAWLNSSILGNGSAGHDCHECRDAPQCGTIEFIDPARCPPRACNTTCFVSDRFHYPSGDQACYQSYCLSQNSSDDELSGHRVKIEGIIYGNRSNASLELREIYIYCRADDCSRLEIFDELRGQFTVNLTDLSAFFNITIVPTTSTTAASTSTAEPTIICYDCYCYDDLNCACNTFTEADAKLSHCTIIRENYDQDFFVSLGHVNRNSTYIYIREFPYLLVKESIINDESTKRWNTRTNLVVYGCNTSYCNHPNFVPYLPDSFQMRLNEVWLNTNVLGTGQPVRNCHECPNPNAPVCSTTDFINNTLCPVADCNTTCFISDVYDDPEKIEQCYQSFCAPPDSAFFTIDPHRVEMEGILYLYPMGRPVELRELDIFCRADDCTRPTIFNEIKNQFTTVVDDLNIFYTISTTTRTESTTILTGIPTVSSSIASQSSSTMTPSTDTTTTRSASQSGSTMTSPTNTTTPKSASVSTYTAHIILISFFLRISLFNLY